MTDSPRTRAARRLRARARELAHTANEAFLRRHPEWLERHGDRARTHGEKDARFHLDFLASAVEMDSPGSFAEYLRWTIELLESRGMSRDDLYVHVDDLLAAIGDALPEEQRAAVARIAEEGISRARDQGSLERARDKQAREPGHGREPAGELATTCRLFTQATLQGNRKAATRIAEEALRSGTDIQELFVDVLQASQYEVGRLWQANEISVAQEHMATAVTQTVIALLFDKLQIPEDKHGTVVITGVAGEQHHLGGRMVADILETDGWDVRFLGAELPQDGILEVIDEEDPAIVGISATILTSLPAVASLISGISGHFGEQRPRILVGGRAFHGDPRLWRQVGADRMGRDLRDALKAARVLAG